MLNIIEETARWPKEMSKARAAFMQKNPDKDTDPLQYRVLTILSAVYRRWASLRLYDMQDWTDEWHLPEMYAGTGAQGAENYFYLGWEDLITYSWATHCANPRASLMVH